MPQRPRRQRPLPGRGRPPTRHGGWPLLASCVFLLWSPCSLLSLQLMPAPNRCQNIAHWVSSVRAIPPWLFSGTPCQFPLPRRGHPVPSVVGGLRGHQERRGADVLRRRRVPRVTPGPAWPDSNEPEECDPEERGARGAGDVLRSVLRPRRVGRGPAGVWTAQRGLSLRGGDGEEGKQQQCLAWLSCSLEAEVRCSLRSASRTGATENPIPVHYLKV